MSLTKEIEVIFREGRFCDNVGYNIYHYRKSIRKVVGNIHEEQ